MIDSGELPFFRKGFTCAWIEHKVSSQTPLALNRGLGCKLHRQISWSLIPKNALSSQGIYIYKGLSFRETLRAGKGDSVQQVPIYLMRQ